ncbi:hypothetical protein BDA96_06G231700 [Sorghum bicolor]|jgi:hypothetical protein|uniref:Uncharacterized protein n=2 Tax=Sorghum bicolor TaxID=4558 RepID=A0A921QTI2_SORBI|nr:hypothetical protein BDA96_06G231700 [Sorghum bicolor]KXG27100.1 hypothetical protein SORBI_3006G212300 [Sorghum bicolor]
MDYWFCTGCKGAAIVEDPSLFSCSMGSMLEWTRSASLSEWLSQLVPSLHLSMAQTCRVIGGTMIDAYMQWRRMGKLAVCVGLWCVDHPKTHPGLWLRLL